MRLRRHYGEQDDMDRLEGDVLDGLLQDPVLRDRGIDIGAISPGIIELSGSVHTEEEAVRAVALANRITGVRTVVRRLDVEEGGRRVLGARRDLDPEDLEATFARLEGRVGGMGRRRQGAQTEPDRRDDSQHMRENALAAADREQWADEGLVGRSSSGDTRPSDREGPRRFAEDEMDNQDPHGKYAKRTLDSPPEDLNSASRVGEPPKPGTRLRLERSDVSDEEAAARDRVD